MAKRKNIQAETTETIVDLQEVKHDALGFFEKYQKLILIVGGALIALVGGYFAYKYLYQMPNQEKAVAQMYKAQEQFERDSFNLALTNPGGGSAGFLDIIKKYGGSPASNLAYYYAGICYLNMSDYNNAVKYLDDYSPKDEITAITKYGSLGDAYSELKKFDDAMSNYKKAASYDNDFLTPFYLKKLGMLQEKQGDNKSAKDSYQKIKENYPQSNEGRDIEKYMMRAEAMANAKK
ncbi:MAG: tetratricopeptide repeat protein [Saprospiraceae bacterium]|nr:tetratricopeptide repeat protein [Saprospiraceae bacterium]